MPWSILDTLISFGSSTIGEGHIVIWSFSLLFQKTTKSPMTGYSPTSMYLGPLRELCEERIFWRKHTWQEKGWKTGVFKGSKLEVFKARWLNCRDIRWYCWMIIRSILRKFTWWFLPIIYVWFFLRARCISGIKNIIPKRWTIHSDHVGWWITQIVHVWCLRPTPTMNHQEQ